MVLQIVFDGYFDRNTIRVGFVRQVVNRQADLLRLPGDGRGLCSLRRGLLRVVLDPLILPGVVTNANKIGAVLGRFGSAPYREPTISPSCSLDLLPVIDSLNCHLVSSPQGHARLYNSHEKCSIL